MHEAETVVDESHVLQPSPFVKQFTSRMIKGASGLPIADIACGSGRNAFCFAQLKCTVLCVDRDLGQLKKHSPRQIYSKRLRLYEMDLLADPWPFAPDSIGGVVLVDYLERSLFELFNRSVAPGGYILIETVSARGGNYLELPKAGELRNAFQKSCEICVYKEKKAGPPAYDAMTVKMLARRRST